MAKQTTKLVKNLERGDHIITEDGKVVRVTGLTNGFYRNSTRIAWHSKSYGDGWSCLTNDTEVILPPTPRPTEAE